MTSITSTSQLSQIGVIGGTQGKGRHGPPPGPPPDATEMTSDFMSDFDTDNSGTVDKAELSKELSSKGVSNADEVADTMLTELGGTDGTISKDQVSAAFDARQKEMDEKFASMRVRMQTGSSALAAGATTDATAADGTTGSSSTAWSAGTTYSSSTASNAGTTAAGRVNAAASTDDTVLRFASMLGHYRSFDGNAAATETQTLLAAA